MAKNINQWSLTPLISSPLTAAITYGLIGLSPAAVEAVVVNRAVNAQAAANAWTRGTYTGESVVAYNGSVYRYSDPKYASTTWEIHSANIAESHRYSPSGVGAVYAGTSSSTAQLEVLSYFPSLEGKVLISGNIQIEGVLDLTNPAALKALGVTKTEITASSHGANGSYNQTQRIAQWAREQGYKAILAPSAQNRSGTNLVMFDSLPKK